MHKLTEEQIQDTMKRFHMDPIEMEERISTLDKPLIIESACPGWQPKYWGPRHIYPVEPPGYVEGGVRFEAVPVTVEEQVRDNVEALKAGVAVIHFHPRDPETGICLADNPKGEMTEKKLMAEILDLTFRQADAITVQHSWKPMKPPKGYGEEPASALAAGIDYVTDTKNLLDLGKGNKYCQGVVVLWPPAKSYPPNYAQSVQEGVRYMEEHDVKPVHKLRSSFNVRELKRTLIDTGVLTRKPFILVHDMGHPYGWPMDIDPWMPIDMIASIEQTKRRIPDSIIGVFSGGRNWMPITMTAILAGVDFIRVGIEDCYWLYPHKDEVIKSNTQVVKLIVDFAHMVGREVATAKQAREIMGIKLTSRA